MKALLFDFDGLLMDTESPLVDTWRRIYHRHGVEFPLQTWIEQVVGSTDHPFDPAAHLAETSGLALDMKAIQEEVKRQELELRQHPLPMVGSREILAEAKRLGLRQAVVSSSSHEWVESNLEKLGMKPFFENFTCREDAMRTKPAPDLYLKALDRLGLLAEDCLVFEDSPNGIRAAHEAGIRVVGVPNPITIHAGPLQADVVLSSLAEISLEALLARFDD